MLGILAPPAIDIGAGVGRVLEDVQHPGAVRRLPDDLVWLRPAQRPHRQGQPRSSQVAHDGLGAAELAELGEHQPEPGLDLLVRVQAHRAIALVHKTDGQRQAKLAPGSFLPLTLMQPHPDLVQLCLAHDAGQAQQQPVVIGTRVVEPFAIGDDHAEQGAKLEELVPIAVVARQARGIQAEDQAGLAQADLRDQVLKAVPAITGRPRAPEILVDHLDPFSGPAQHHRAIDQTVLQLGALLMLTHLTGRRLAHIDEGQLGAVERRDPIVTGSRRDQHGSPPCPVPRLSGSVPASG